MFVKNFVNLSTPQLRSDIKETRLCNKKTFKLHLYRNKKYKHSYNKKQRRKALFSLILRIRLSDLSGKWPEISAC